MIKIAKKASLLGLILSISWLGVTVGQSLTRQIFDITSTAQAATTAKGAPSTAAQNESADERYQDLEMFQKVLHFVETNYVDDKVKTKELIYGALSGMMEKLDPHSNFLPPDVWKDMKIDTSGKFGGLGNHLPGVVPGFSTPKHNLEAPDTSHTHRSAVSVGGVA